MEKTLCDDCSKEAKVKIDNRSLCTDCGMRVLQQDASSARAWMGDKRKGHGLVSYRKL